VLKLCHDERWEFFLYYTLNLHMLNFIWWDSNWKREWKFVITIALNLDEIFFKIAAILKIKSSCSSQKISICKTFYQFWILQKEFDSKWAWTWDLGVNSDVARALDHLTIAPDFFPLWAETDYITKRTKSWALTKNIWTLMYISIKKQADLHGRVGSVTEFHL
jgi:hypothetical protein